GARPLELGAEAARAGGGRVEDVCTAGAAMLQPERVPPRRFPEGTRLGRGDGERSAVLGHARCVMDLATRAAYRGSVRNGSSLRTFVFKTALALVAALPAFGAAYT